MLYVGRFTMVLLRVLTASRQNIFWCVGTMEPTANLLLDGGSCVRSIPTAQTATSRPGPDGLRRRECCLLSGFLGVGGAVSHRVADRDLVIFPQLRFAEH
jgi:hypothetical protein